MPRKFLRLVAIAAVVTVGFAACDDDDDNENADAGGEETAEQSEFCKIALEFLDLEGPPDQELINRYAAAAPDEIKADADFIANKLEEADGNFGEVFGDPKTEEAIGNLEAFETAECGIEHDDSDEDPGDPEPAEGATVVEVTGVEYAFEGVPDELEAGLTALAFTNAGEEAHEMFVGKLAEGKTLDDVLAFEGDPFEAGLAEEVGFAFGEPGAETRYVNGELTAGNYGMVCFIPGPEGKPHVELGMRAEFTVA